MTVDQQESTCTTVTRWAHTKRTMSLAMLATSFSSSVLHLQSCVEIRSTMEKQAGSFLTTGASALLRKTIFWAIAFPKYKWPGALTRPCDTTKSTRESREAYTSSKAAVVS